MPNDERSERIEILLDIMGDYNGLCDELTAEPASYGELIGGLDCFIQTLRDARGRIKKLQKEVKHGRFFAG